jgi:hypothetical protein
MNSPHDPLQPHPLAFLAPVDTSLSFEEFEKDTLKSWGYSVEEDLYEETLVEAYGPKPHHWRDNLRRAWNEVNEDTITNRTTPLRMALFRHGVKPSRPEDDGTGTVPLLPGPPWSIMVFHGFSWYLQYLLRTGTSRTFNSIHHRGSTYWRHYQ